MENPNTLVAIADLVCGGLFIALALQLVLGKVPMNRLYGVRLYGVATRVRVWRWDDREMQWRL